MTQAKRRKPKIINRDRISDLPQPIIHQILSLLSPVELIKTCLLSKTFQAAVNSFPVIDLDRSSFKADPSWRHLESDFVKYVNRRIQRLKLDNAPLHKFRFRAEIKYAKQRVSIRNAVIYAIKNRVQDLLLDLVTPGHSLYLHNIMSANSLVTLSLFRMSLPNFNDLDLSSCWPLLENLLLSDCSGFRKFKFSSTRIRSIALQSHQLDDVKIRSPSLHNFKFASGNHKTVIDISECDFLRSLSLECVRLADNWLEDNVPKLVNLEDLQVSGMPLKVVSSKYLKNLVLSEISERVKIRVSSLQSLTVNECFYNPISFKRYVGQLKHVSWHKATGITIEFLKELLSVMDGFDCLELELTANCGLISFQINRPESNLSGKFSDVDKIVKLKFQFRELGLYMFAIVHQLKCIIKPFTQLLDVTLLINSESRLGNCYFVTLWNWIAYFGRVKVFTLACSNIQELLYPVNKRVNLLSPIHDLKSLTVELLTLRDISPELVDSFLWQSPNLETLSFVSTRGDKRSIEFECGSRISAEEDPICCECLSMKCLRHSIRKVVLKNFDDVERHWLGKYFSGNAGENTNIHIGEVNI